MIHLSKKLQINNFIFFLGIFVTKLTLAYSNEAICTIENGSVCNMQNNIYDPHLCGRTFECSATLLYLKPSIDDTHYVLSSIDNTFNNNLYPNGKRHQNTAEFTPGFKVEALFDICQDTSSLDFRFTYLNSHAKDSTSGDFLFDTNGFPGFGSQDSPLYAGEAKSRNSYRYYAGDITYNRTFCCFFPEHFTFIFGLHCAYIKFKEHTTSSGTYLDNNIRKTLSNDLHRNSQFWGIGPQIGLDYHFLLSRLSNSCGRWSLDAKARCALLCGNSKSDLKFVTLRTGPEGVGVDNGNLWRVIPSASTELSINYILGCARIDIGYEWIWYSDAVNKITGVDVAYAGDTIDVFNSFNLNGPFLRINCAF